MKRTRADVVILGAGVAGLACAARLVAGGAAPMLLEARGRIGGRVWTMREAGHSLPIELGAEFVHGRPRDLLDVAHAAGLAVYRCGGAGWRVEGTKLTRHDGMRPAIDRVLGSLRVDDDTTLAKALARSGAKPATRDAAAAFVQGFDAAPPTEVSAAWIVRAQRTAPDEAQHTRRIASGYDGVVEALAGAAQAGGDKLRTATIATDVVWGPGRVHVRCVPAAGGPVEEIEADRVVVAVPLGVLQAEGGPGALRFDPPLPPRVRAAIASLAMGHVVKITVRFREPLWETRATDLGFLHAPGEAVPTWWSWNPFDEPRLIGWAGGRGAQALLAGGETHVLDAALGSLANALRIPPGKLRRAVASWWFRDWSADPFTRGAYAYARVGGARAWRALSQPLRGTLVFAGEAVSDAAESATVHGAMRSGVRAAEACLRRGP